LTLLRQPIELQKNSHPFEAIKLFKIAQPTEIVVAVASTSSAALAALVAFGKP
jgi:hypothetical protein